ncbi:cytochrome c oxidase subunit 6b-1-like [Typha angustifolia]|uniref:cytochrome c oxidase subunit 6b-1-like n=1 Tax=Typha angustifolia TaxID=59011 RepID=UPI003C2D0EE8
MADEAQQEKTLALPEDNEQSDQNEVSVEVTENENPVTVTSEEVSLEKPEESPNTEETGPVVEENSENPDSQEEDVEEVAEEQPAIKIETAPADFRFPTTNQTRHCFTRYIEYHRCIAAKGEDASDCDKFAKYYRSLCPSEWVERWNEQRENGSFPGPL